MLKKFLFVSILVCSCINPAIAQLKTVTIAQIMAARNTTTPSKPNPTFCQGGAFKPCICAGDVSKKVMYRPSVKECGKKAAIILTGTAAAAFSTVVRDKFNADRIPANALINGCSAFERDTLGLNKCSVYKAQKVIKKTDDRGAATVYCLGAAGDSSYFARVTRITVKFADSAKDSNDPLGRYCLKSPTKNLN